MLRHIIIVTSALCLFSGLALAQQGRPTGTVPQGVVKPAVVPAQPASAVGAGARSSGAKPWETIKNDFNKFGKTLKDFGKPSSSRSR